MYNPVSNSSKKSLVHQVGLLMQLLLLSVVGLRYRCVCACVAVTVVVVLSP